MQTKKLSPSKTSTPVVVETKKISESSCCSNDSVCSCSCTKVSHIIMMVLLIVNTVFLVMSFSMIRNNESIKVGWRENYKMAKDIYKTDWFKAYQKQQIQQALQMFKWWTQQQNPAQDSLNVPTWLETQNTVELPKK